MKTVGIAAVIAVALSCLVSLPLANAESHDPCGGKNSNMELRKCYTEEQTKATLETDLLTNKIAASLRKDAEDPDAEGVIADVLTKAASALEQSQKTWKAYRDHHCKAIEYTWGPGSGAGTAREACRFQVGQTRLRELRTDFQSELK
jgi:uncharacterized protein YecT (DUF1311 family)